MPFELIWEEDGVVIRYHGALTTDEVFESSDVMLDDSRWPGCRYYIADSSEADVSRLSVIALRRVAAQHLSARHLNPDVNGVAIVTNNLARGLVNLYARWFNAMGGQWNFRMVATQDEARKHLGLVPQDIG